MISQVKHFIYADYVNMGYEKVKRGQKIGKALSRT